MSMMVGATTIKWLEQPEDSALEYLEYLVENEPEDCWVIQDQGHTLLEIGMDNMSRLAQEWRQEAERTDEDLAEVKKWIEDVKRQTGEADPVMFYLSE